MLLGSYLLNLIISIKIDDKEINIIDKKATIYLYKLKKEFMIYRYNKISIVIIDYIYR